MVPRVGYGSTGVNHSLMLTSYHVRVERGGNPIKQVTTPLFSRKKFSIRKKENNKKARIGV